MLDALLIYNGVSEESFFKNSLAKSFFYTNFALILWATIMAKLCGVNNLRVAHTMFN